MTRPRQPPVSASTASIGMQQKPAPAALADLAQPPALLPLRAEVDLAGVLDRQHVPARAGRPTWARPSPRSAARRSPAGSTGSDQTPRSRCVRPAPDRRRQTSAPTPSGPTAGPPFFQARVSEHPQRKRRPVHGRLPDAGCRNHVPGRRANHGQVISRSGCVHTLARKRGPRLFVCPRTDTNAPPARACAHTRPTRARVAHREPIRAVRVRQ